MRARRKIYGLHIDRPRSICGAYRKFTDTNIENGHFLCVYARAGEEITVLRSIYADRKPLHRKPSHAKEKIRKPSYAYVSARIRKMPVWEIFRKLALIPGNVRT